MSLDVLLYPFCILLVAVVHVYIVCCIFTNKILVEPVSDVYRSANCIGSVSNLHEPIRGPFILHLTQCSLHFDREMLFIP